MLTEVKVVPPPPPQDATLVNHSAALNASCIFPGLFKNSAFKHCICSQSVVGRRTTCLSQLLSGVLTDGKQRCYLSR